MLLRMILGLMIRHFGIQSVNDALAEVVYAEIRPDDETRETYEHNRFHDELSEAYDAIDLRFFKHHGLDARNAD